MQLRVAQEEFAAATILKSNIVRWMNVIAAVWIVVVGFSVWMVIGGVKTPLKRMQQAMGHLASGDRALSMPCAGGRKDEIGEMACAVEIFRQAAISNHRFEEEAQEARNSLKLTVSA